MTMFITGLPISLRDSIGYTPEQAWRIASASVSVDHSPETEPVQGPRLSAQFLGMAVLSNPPLPGDEQLQLFRQEAEAQWRFHAFRDSAPFSAVVRQRPAGGSRRRRSQEAAGNPLPGRRGERNLGIFLHSFQDSVPHARYVTPFGHWICPPEAPGMGLPIGSTTDWLSFRDKDANLQLVNDTANRLLSFANDAAETKPKQRLHAYDAANMSQFIDGMRQVNAAPPSLQGGSIEAITLEAIKAKASDPKHADGPTVPAALTVINQAMERVQMVEKAIPPEPIPYELKLSPPPGTGAYFTDRDKSVLFGELRVKVVVEGQGSTSPSGNLPLRVRVLAIPTQRGETEYELESETDASPSPARLQGNDSFLLP